MIYFSKRRAVTRTVGMELFALLAVPLQSQAGETRHYSSWFIALTAVVVIGVLTPELSATSPPASFVELENKGYQLLVKVVDGVIIARLEDRTTGTIIADGPVIYRVARQMDRLERYDGIKNPQLSVKGDCLTISGSLAGVEIEHRFVLPDNRLNMEECIVVRNDSNDQIALTEFEIGLTREVADANGKIVSAMEQDRVVAVPFRHRAIDTADTHQDYGIADLVAEPGRVYRPNTDWEPILSRPSRHRCSEGWAWTHGEHTLGVYSYCQDNMMFSVISTVARRNGVALRFGGAVMIESEPAALGRIAPGESIDLGVIRYETIAGGYAEAMYAYRDMLDEKGCCFPKDYDPPVHWEQLYDMEGAWKDRLHQYTKARIEEQAELARSFSCEAIYLDPGWDTDFGTFLWGEKWLGSRKDFVDEMKSKYDLDVSLHCPLATWMSHEKLTWGPDAMNSYPEAAHRLIPVEDVEMADASRTGQKHGLSKTMNPSLCLGSKQYLDTAAERLLANCADGVAFIMLDGNWWNGGCCNPDHGHPVPYRMEDHIRANLSLAQRIHAKYPNVIIEMHDMLTGGHRHRATPIYYKYGLPGSFNESWGFELMWNMLDDIKSSRALMLYYYNMSCNIPLYLHVDLSQDNSGLIGLWWYASTCRHLGIGGSHENPSTVEAQQAAMRYYSQLARFFKRGQFYGIHEEIHLHVLPDEQAFVVNIFNLSDETRVISGNFELRKADLQRSAQYSSSAPWCRVEDGVLHVELELAPWSAQVADVRGH